MGRRGGETQSGVAATRTLALMASATIAVLAALILLRILGADGLNWIDNLRLILVLIATFWLAWGAMVALIGIFVRRVGRDDFAQIDAAPIRTRTVMLVPIHKEDPAATFARIAAMDADLTAQGLGHHVQIAILSDTPEGPMATREEVWFMRLLLETGGKGRVFYRRRLSNVGRKAGNIADFLRRSGGAWDHALILDADSLMEAQTIGRMIRRMEAAPGLGLLQTAPRVIRARSRFGRAMQFAASFHGAVFMQGLARLQGRTGPFWGHNALVRIRAFAQSSGLPELSGPAPFGGHILSHDYVEAALLARAGWEVRLDPDLTGSYEEAPDSILAHAARERRWCQGNLQHARLLLAPALRPWSRFVFVQGILSYVAPVLWLLFLGASLLSAATQAPEFEQVLIPIVGANPMEGSMAEWLRAEWATPVLEPDMATTALGLALGVVGLLVVPKLMILADAALRRRAVAYGGPWRAAAGVLAELGISALIAPILLMYQAKSVVEVLGGRDIGWPAQSRTGEVVPLSVAWASAWWITLSGAAIAVAALVFAPALLIWLSPVCLPMLCAPMIITWTSRPGGHWLFATPTDLSPTPVMTRHAAILARWQSPASEVPADDGLSPVPNG